MDCRRNYCKQKVAFSLFKSTAVHFFDTGPCKRLSLNMVFESQHKTIDFVALNYGRIARAVCS